MPRNFNKYQYETSPRKLEPDYTPIRKKKTPKKSTVKKVETTIKSMPKKVKKQQTKTVIYVVIAFAVLFAISYRNSQIDESFAKIQDLKQELSELEKENMQLEISIENSTNLNNLEQQAKELLGMQKLSSKQTVYVNLPKSDYIEPASEKVVIKEDKSIFKSVVDGVVNIFK